MKIYFLKKKKKKYLLLFCYYIISYKVFYSLFYTL